MVPAAALLALFTACGDQPTQPRDMAIAIDSVSPAASEADLTLEIRILGTGFRSGAEMSIERGGSAAAGVIAEQTSFVSDRELLATVRIAADAVPALYDVVVSNPDGARAAAGGIFTVEGETPPIVVATAQPSEAGQGETVQVRITGSGFRQGDEVAWERDGSIDDRVVVQQTLFVSDQELIATISVQADAAIATYDVAVSRPRKRGIGSEVFDILPGLGSELEAMFRFTYDGYRSDSFQVDDAFVLDPATMDPGSWGLTHYTYEQGEQFLGAHHLRQDGLVDMMWCWVPGGRVREPGTRALECWFTPQYNWETGEYADPEDYTSWVHGDRPGDGTGTVTFTAVTPERLSGTFSITMHVVDWHDWLGSPSIEIKDGEFNLPVVSSYYDRGPDDGNGPDPVVGSGSYAATINDLGVVAGIAYNEIGVPRAVRWMVSSGGTVTGPEELGEFAGGTYQYTTAINNEGVIIGNASPHPSFHGGFIYDGTIRALTPLDNAAFTRAYGINDKGMVVGDSDMHEGSFTDLRGLVWLNPLDPEERPIQLPHRAADYTVTNPMHINNNGVIAGWSGGMWVRWEIGPDGTVSDPEPIGLDAVTAMNDAPEFTGFHNTLATLLRGASLIPLGPLPGYPISEARGLNNPLPGKPLQVVGSSIPARQSNNFEIGTRPVVWSVDAAGAATGPTDLGLPVGYDAAQPSAVNAHGWIVGTAYNGGGNQGASGLMATLWRPQAGGRTYDVITLGDLVEPASMAPAVSAGQTRCRPRPGRPDRCR